MPGVGNAIVAVVKFAFSKHIVAQIGRAIVVVAASNYIARRNQPSFDPDLGTRSLTTRGTQEPEKLIYGLAAVSGPLAHPPQTSGPQNRELWNTILLSSCELNAIRDVWLDDRFVAEADIAGGAPGGGVVNAGEFAPAGGLDVLRINKHLGTVDQVVDPHLSAALGSAWGPDHRLRGRGYLVTMMNWFDRTDDLWRQREPRNVSALCEGKRTYDPRLDTSPGSNPADETYWSWNQNNALHAGDYMRGAPRGGNDTGKWWAEPVLPARIDWDAIAHAADVCDGQVDTPAGLQARYTNNLVVFGSAEPSVGLEAIIRGMAGSLSVVGDRWVVRAGEYVAPVDNLFERDITGPLGMSTGLQANRRFNSIKASYIEPNDQYQPAETPVVAPATYLARDGGRPRPRSVDYPGVSDFYQAQRLNLLALDDANDEFTVKIPATTAAARLVPGETFNLWVAERGWNPRVFTCQGWQFREAGADELGVEIQAREITPVAWDDPAVSEYTARTVAGPFVPGLPEAVPPIDTLPRGIPTTGVWNVQLVANQVAGGGADDGEIRHTVGTFVAPGAAAVNFAAEGTIATPYEIDVRPPDGVFFVVLRGATFLVAVYDRIRREWRSVDNDNVETVFSPLAGDQLVARGIKTTTIGGIDSLEPLVPFVPDPEATATAWGSIPGQPSDAALLNAQQQWADVGGAGRPADNATAGATWGGDITGQPSDAALLNNQQQWSDVGGAGRPEDNATQNTGALADQDTVDLASQVAGELGVGNANAALRNVNQQWSDVAGAGRPEDNATVGATWSGDITGQPADAALLNAQQQWSDVGGAGRPEDNATVGATWSGDITGQPADAALLNAQQQWSDVGGAGRPADNATQNTGALADQDTVNLASQVTGQLPVANANTGLRNTGVTMNADGTLGGAGGGQIDALQLLNGPAEPGATASPSPTSDSDSGTGNLSASATITRGGASTTVVVDVSITGAVLGAPDPFPLTVTLKRDAATIKTWANLTGSYEPGNVGAFEPAICFFGFTATCIDTDAGTGSTTYEVSIVSTQFTETCEITAEQTYFS